MPFCCISLKNHFLLFWFVSFRFKSFIHKFLSFISFHFISFPFMPFHLISFIHLMSFHFMSFPILSYCFTHSFHSIPFIRFHSIGFHSIWFESILSHSFHFILFHVISIIQSLTDSLSHSVVDSLKKCGSLIESLTHSLHHWFIDRLFPSLTPKKIVDSLRAIESPTHRLLRWVRRSVQWPVVMSRVISMASQHLLIRWHTHSFPDPSQKSTPLYRLLISAPLGTGRHYLVTLWYFQIQQSVAISNRFGRAVLKMLSFSSTSHAPQQLTTIRSLAVGIRGWLSHLTREWHCLGNGSFTKKTFMFMNILWARNCTYIYK